LHFNVFYDVRGCGDAVFMRVLRAVNLPGQIPSIANRAIFWFLRPAGD
jgi:hypothetical protein